jgi:hypothetical protein
MNQSKTDLGIVNESQLLRFGIRGNGAEGGLFEKGDEREGFPLPPLNQTAGISRCLSTE